jgi:hypothetical protein
MQVAIGNARRNARGGGATLFVARGLSKSPPLPRLKVGFVLSSDDATSDSSDDATSNSFSQEAAQDSSSSSEILDRFVLGPLPTLPCGLSSALLRFSILVGVCEDSGATEVRVVGFRGQRFCDERLESADVDTFFFAAHPFVCAGGVAGKFLETPKQAMSILDLSANRPSRSRTAAITLKNWRHDNLSLDARGAVRDSRKDFFTLRP